MIALLIAGCSSGDKGVQAVGPGPQGVDAPTFTGPWADYFRSAYSTATTDLQRTILSDGKITDQENQEVRNAFVSCMAAFDIRVELQEYDSTKSIAPTGMTDAKYDELSRDCRARTSGQISGLYFQINRNPENRDESAIMAECLSRKGLVERNYSAKDYEAASGDQNFPFDAADPRFRACGLDPLNREEAMP
ncbi:MULTISPECIES: hypothetical protein [Arthrobacter]|uniref:Uncharacterized protein n=1 Tax=Arthrobacter terricola TaxID=2547396 RepID=A0A4R5K7V7_9MICC|nr:MULTISPECIES: hypothetical protein [Arthrobacter]MBT8163542.1 hypothetical protein [Arthrobacter sp. GN70]TDF88873.1 hypothetical protein E1809_23310 [Arthrobacter terricola]